MLRRFDSLPQVALTLCGAILLALIVEAEGLRTWAQRLELGALRSASLAVAEAWADAVRPLGLSAPRAQLLGLKETLTPVFAPALQAPPTLAQRPSVDLPVTPAVETVAEPLAAGSLPASVTALVATASMPLAKPVAGPVEGVRPLVLPAEELRIALTGDSMMAVGLAPAITRGLGVDKRVQLVRAFRSGTGLSRPEVFDWLDRYPRMLGEVRPDLVICSMGANDAQNVQVGREVLRFGTPEWDAFYLQRLDDFLNLITADNTRVLWVGMPVMREKGFSRRMAHMNELVQQALQAHPSVQWLDPNPALGYADNAFAQYRANARGKLVKLRADDGIHMTDEGAGFLVEPIRAWLEAQAAPRPAIDSQPSLAGLPAL